MPASHRLTNPSSVSYLPVYSKPSVNLQSETTNAPISQFCITACADADVYHGRRPAGTSWGGGDELTEPSGASWETNHPGLSASAGFGTGVWQRRVYR